MARMSHLSTMALAEGSDPLKINITASEIRADLHRWWCSDGLREQSNDRRRRVRSCMLGCVIYLNHILNPLFREPRSTEVTEAISEILEIARMTPEGQGLEMGLYFGLFMAGIAVLNEPGEEELLRRKFKADQGISIYVCITRRRFRSCLTELACGSCAESS
jgi:hypothetical protein